jgi:perosamine synthetase
MRNVVAVNSGTSALHLALVLAGVGEGDEVILPAQTFVATGLAVLYCGAKPVFADIGMDGNLSWEDACRKWTKKTKAIILVSWGGNPPDMDEFAVRVRDFGKIILDNAHALGATYLGKDLSAFSHFSCYSFQAIKALSTGDGGAMVCRRPEDYERAKRLRWFGIDREKDLPDETGERQYNLQEIGYKYHMNNVAASIGLGNLVGFKERQERVKKIAKIYDEKIAENIPVVEKKSGCSYWLYDILIPERESFIRAMKSRGVPTSVVHVGIDRNDVFGGIQDLPVQRYWDEHHVCLPIHAGLTDEDVEQVVEGVRKGW